MRGWIGLTLVGLALGLAVGVWIGWVAWPVTYYNTAIADLRQDYQDEYLLMVAAAYEVEATGSTEPGKALDRAQERLVLLDPEEPEASVVELAERLIAEGGERADILRLVRLADALGVASVPHLEGGP